MEWYRFYQNRKIDKESRGPRSNVYEMEARSFYQIWNCEVAMYDGMKWI